jgi:putative nucleotide binding protein
MEEYVYVLDFLPMGKAERGRFREGAVAYGVGEDNFALLELLIKKDANLLVGDKIYVGKELERREKISRIKGRVSYGELTTAAKKELPFVLELLVKDQDQRFVKFFNDAQPITTRFHILELLPGLGKKTMWELIEERKKGQFKSLGDIAERTSVHHPEKLLARRIELELADPEAKYRVFVTR